MSAPYDSAYSMISLGSVSGVPANYGGLTLLDNSTLLLGGAANGASGAIYSIGITRDVNQHITGFTGTATLYKNAPNIDGGLSFGPGGVLFATTFANNNLLQYKPGGGLNPDKTINLTPLGISSSTGSLVFVPSGYGLPDAGGFRILSYSGGGYYTGTLTPDGSGTYNLSNIVQTATIGGGPEGMIYVPPGSPIFNPLNQYALITRYSNGRVSAYQLDANGDPIAATESFFITGLTGAEGALYDPVSGDFLFSTFGGGNQIMRISGFATVPEPSTIILSGLGLSTIMLVGYKKARKRFGKKRRK
ncbi:MAG: PEP-CTERM sorting domain-containing protein [Gemmatales bacterium]